MKKIMILGASILQLPAIKKAKEMGLEVVVVDMNPDAVSFQTEGIEKEIISTIDIPEIVKAAKRHSIDGIMTLATDMPMRAVAAVAKEMNLIGISADTAVKATNKAEMRNALKKAGVPIPVFYKVSTKEEYLEAVGKIKEAGYRCIIKPADNSGSRGIDLLKDYNSETVEKAYNYSKESSRSGDLMVEEYMEGPEVSVETLSVNGVCHVIQITDKLTTDAPYFVEMGHSQPSGHTEEIKKQIAKVAIAANHAIGISNGPSHTEIKITKDGPKGKYKFMYERYIKRCLDVIFAVIALPIVLVVCIIFGALIWLEDRGTIFYLAKRRGKDGTIFNMYKLRSMKVNAPDIRNKDNSTFNSADDPRVTKIGKLMRKISVDELPQVFNILKGDMSWIGPRPVTTDRPLSEYDQKRKDRLKVKPGITGYTQAYYRNNISQEDKLALDAKYAQKVTFLGDLKIFFKTIETVVCRKNVYTN